MSYKPADHVLSIRHVIAAWMCCGGLAVAGVALTSAGHDKAASPLAGAADPHLVAALDHNAVWARTALLDDVVTPPRRGHGFVCPFSPS